MRAIVIYFIFSVAASLLISANAKCYCEEYLDHNYVHVDSNYIQAKAFHVLDKVYINATNLFKQIDVSYTLYMHYTVPSVMLM
jgi:hypothetical protein